MKPKRVTIQKEQKEKDGKFDLMAIDNNQLIHVTELEQKLKKLVEENPFVSITDKKSYELAKTRKAILKNARLELRTTGKKESQESILITKLNGIKDFVKEKITYLVAIPTAPEDLQQEEIDRFDLIMEEQKNEAERLETIRTDAIKAEIERIQGTLQGAIDGSTFATLVDDQLAFRLLAKSSFDFEEFDFLFDEMIEQMTNQFDINVEYINANETKRINELQGKIESTLNQMIVDGQQLVDQIDGTIDEKLLKQMTSGIFQTMIDCDVEFDQESLEKMESEKQKVLTKISEKITLIKQQEINEQRERIIEVREGLLDIIFDLTPDKIEETTVYINDSLDQEVLPELQAEFDKMKNRVMDSFEKKLASLADEITKAEELEVKRMEKVMEARIKIITELGMVEVESESVSEWIGFGLLITDETLYQEDDIQTIIDEINEAKNDIESKAKAKEVLAERINKIESMGFEFDDLRNEWNGFGCNIVLQKLETINDGQMETFVEYLEQAKKADQAETERQELIKKDKLVMVDRMTYFKNQINQYKPNTLENEQSVDFWNELKKDFLWQIEDKIKTINNF
jgi:hypothetical protein